MRNLRKEAGQSGLEGRSEKTDKSSKKSASYFVALATTATLLSCGGKVAGPEPARGFDCQGTKTATEFTGAYSQDAFATQAVVDTLCDSTISFERSTLNIPIETVKDVSGNVTGLAEGRYTVKVLGESYILLNASAVRMVLGKEAISGILNQGESLPIDNLKFQLNDLEVLGNSVSALISIVDANGNTLKQDKVSPGQTKVFNINGTDYTFHVYQLAPGYTFGAKWADVAILSKVTEVRTDAEFVTTDASYRFNMSWDASKYLQAWQFERTQ